MPYDKNLDKALFSESVEFESTKITVSVMCYNEGTKKLQVSRENQSAEGEWRFSKLGRMTKEESEKVIPLMTKALVKM